MKKIKTQDLAQAEARLPRWMVGCAIAAVVGLFLGGSARLAAGFALGAALGILNYFWLHQAIETLLSAGRSRLSGNVVAKFVLRYPLAFAGVYFFHRTGWLPITAILAGLFIPVVGVLIEAGCQILGGFRQSRIPTEN